MSVFYQSVRVEQCGGYRFEWEVFLRVNSVGNYFVEKAGTW